MFVQSLALMRQQKVIESGIKVPLCHLSALLCQYNIFYSLSQLWSVHHSVTKFRALCHHRLARLIASVARIKVSLWSPTHAPNTTLDSRGLNMSTSTYHKSQAQVTSTKVKVRKDVFELRQQYRETQTHTLDHSSPLSSLFPDTKMYVAMHCALITVTLTLRIIYILPLPPLRYFFIWINNGL